MKQFLLPYLICPACLPDEKPLEVSATRLDGDDIVSGELYCKKCRKRFPIKDGIATLLPEPESGTAGAQMRYDDSELANRYLWSHYADLMGCSDVGDATAVWAGCLTAGATCGLDAGCAVGRITFEMAAQSNWAVGCDLSPAFVRLARRVAQERRLTFSLPLEGNLREKFTCELPPRLPSDTAEFVVANAQALPFAKNTFQQCASLNLLDRVNYPLAHLYEMNRVARISAASFLCADPFSWSTVHAPEERWLGGMVTGKYAGRGVDNVRLLLEGQDRILQPAWKISRQGCATWPLRSHSNHRELISSHYMVAER